ncbi:hypothetical protein [Edaphobacter albus]|uniref:hypothetical protein n=1 Tax=Edaphobacter sp. 4G125 TaxID=2763071 RepID=UPI0016442F8A|nr:hypothetical protein [Edaphobacter sp. 4G125]QNI38191.1 hypothetical protein H7846_08100 [Edaphobacter sp. 4G125]
MNRRKFVLKGAATALATGLSDLSAPAASNLRTGENLVPAKPSGTPNYWCTWAIQNYMYGHHLKDVSPEILEGDSGSRLAHQAMNERVLLGKQGWAHDFFPSVREDLYLLLDDGWESGGTATFELDATKFPSFPGSPAERLSMLNKAIRAANWRGAALWCRNTPGGPQDEHLEAISLDAEIRYWKVDIGDPEFHLVDLRRKNRSPLQFEHVHGEPPLNGDWHDGGRFGTQSWGTRRQEILANTDVYRTYDVTSILSLPTTLDRLAEMLKGAQGHSNLSTLLNVEDEVYVAAVMGCTMGVMRHPLYGLRPGADVDLFFNGSRQAKRRMDEVVRALRWQRIARPFAAGSGSVQVSTEILIDSWNFELGQTWDSSLVGNLVHQGAPACIARNLALPKVTSRGEKPFVFAAKFPSGAVAIGVQERTRPGHGWYMPLANVELHVGDAPGPYGIFGIFASLSLIFDRPLAGKRVFTQDLASNEAFDVTHLVRIDGRSLHLSETNLRDFGLHSATKGDISSPGLVMILR